jgi:hypothetical protein
MEKIKIVIPSHKRPDRVLSKTLVLNPVLCVSKSQAGGYREHNPELEVVEHPDNVVGLYAKRQWCYDHFGDLWMLDDDVIAINKVWDDAYEHVDPVTVTRMLNNIYELACDLNVYLFGITKNPRPNQYQPHAPIRLSGLVSGGCYGLRKSPNLFYNRNLTVMEDFWISLLNAYYNRKCLIDTRICFVQKDTFKNKGGLAEFRNQSVEERDYLEMKRYFGDAIELKRDRAVAKAATKFSRTAYIRF